MQKVATTGNATIIVYDGKDLSEEEEARLRAAAEAMIVKEAPSLERLLAETSLFLHLAEASLPEPKRRMLEQSLRRAAAIAAIFPRVTRDPDAMCGTTMQLVILTSG